MEKMDLEACVESINRLLEENEFQVLLTMPKETQEVQIEDNMGLGPAIQFYAVLKGIKTIIKTMQTELGLDTAAPGWERTVDALLAMVKADILDLDEE